MLKKLVLTIAVLITILLPTRAYAQEGSAENTLEVHFFYRTTCPFCKREKAFLEREITPNFPQVKINYYNLDTNPQSREIFHQLASQLDAKATAVPTIFIGSEMIVGYQGDYTTGLKIKQTLISYLETAGEPSYPKDKEINEIIKIPFINRQINTKDVSLPALTVILGLTDGFNPCAMWVLTFLIALLVNTKSRKKMWQVGGTFILASGIVYFLFMSTWLNTFLFLGFLTPIRIIVGVAAILTGLYHLKEFRDHEEGVCPVTQKGDKFNIKERVKKLVKPAALPATFLGVIGLAFAVNLIELICSAGLPAIYTKVLTMSDLPTWSNYGYLFFYTVLYMLDDTIVFIIAVKTLSMANISGKFSRWSTLGGGILILILGVLLIFKPEALSFH